MQTIKEKNELSDMNIQRRTSINERAFPGTTTPNHLIFSPKKKVEVFQRMQHQNSIPPTHEKRTLFN